ncbi:hypothetical protein JTF08_12615 [Micrococcaceae bacterium RIT802]|nr:hypothetical protein [Micrococcaceae bacterium RIT 802]
MNVTPTSRIRTLMAVTGVGAVLLTATGCSAIALPTGAEYDKSASYEFTDLQDADARRVLPSWTPEDASNIKEEQRTTGNERLIVMDVAAQRTPSPCTALETPGLPTAAEIQRGLAQEGTPRADVKDQAADQRTTALLEADWWPAGREDKATHLCGKWWISVEDGTLYAYTPETHSVAEGVQNDRTEKN